MISSFYGVLTTVLGSPLKWDDSTALATRGKFARLCVEVDLTKLSKFRLRRKIRRIEYEGIHLVCFNCGRYGHGLEEVQEATNELIPGKSPNTFSL